MLYIEKKSCPPHIQEDIDSKIKSKEWQGFPERPSSEQSRIMRRKYFNRLNKSAIREALIAEQHGLCAYCMCRVVNSGNTTTIEHVMPLSKSKAGAMSYANWLAVCKGGQNIEPEADEKRVVCCDVKKGNTIAKLNPMKKEQMEWIAYCDDGTIAYHAPSREETRTMTEELNSVFGLNGIIDPKTGHSRKDTTTGIVKKRKDAYIAMYDALMELHLSQELTPELIVRFRNSLLSDRSWEPFVGVKLYVLDLFQEILSSAAN